VVSEWFSEPTHALLSCYYLLFWMAILQFLISQGSVATVIRWDEQSYTHLRKVSSLNVKYEVIQKISLAPSFWGRGIMCCLVGIINDADDAGGTGVMAGGNGSTVGVPPSTRPGGPVVLPSLTAGSPVALAPPLLSEFQSPSRPNHGVEGQPIQLRANHFQVRVPRGFIHHYDVSIQPDKCPRRVNR